MATAQEEKKSISVASSGFGLIDFITLPSGVTQEIIPLVAEDGGDSRGVLYTRGGEQALHVVVKWLKERFPGR
jgi:hypothetical protein